MNRLDGMSEAELAAEVDRLEAEMVSLAKAECDRVVEARAVEDRHAQLTNRIATIEKDLAAANARVRDSMRPIAVIRRIPDETQWSPTRGKA